MEEEAEGRRVTTTSLDVQGHPIIPIIRPQLLRHVALTMNIILHLMKGKEFLLSMNQGAGRVQLEELHPRLHREGAFLRPLSCTGPRRLMRRINSVMERSSSSSRHLGVTIVMTLGDEVVHLRPRCIQEDEAHHPQEG